MDSNVSIILGRLATMPQMKGFKKRDGTDGYRTFFRAAVTRKSDLGRPRAERRTDFIPVTCWGKVAQNVAEHLKKGDEVYLIGEYHCDRGEAIPNTNPVRYAEYHGIHASFVQFGRRSLKNQTGQNASGNAAEALASRIAAAGDGQPSSAAPVGGENPFDEAQIA